jgi:hypothetical protein
MVDWERHQTITLTRATHAMRGVNSGAQQNALQLLDGLLAACRAHGQHVGRARNFACEVNREVMYTSPLDYEYQR